MKEVKYKGNLENDFILLTDEAKKNKIRVKKALYGLSLFVTFLCFGGLSIYGVPFLFNSAITIVLIGTLTYMNITMEKQEKMEELEAEKKLNDLSIQLKEHNVQVEKINLVNKVKKFKNDSFYVYDNMSQEEKEVTKVLDIEKYWTLLDNNEQIQVLKFARTILINNNDNRITKDNYFLLEEEDKQNLDVSIKKVLKINK